MKPVNEKPILFSGPMVRAILDGRKTQTRRIVSPQFSTLWGQGCPNQHGFSVMQPAQAKNWRDAYAVHTDIEDSTGAWTWLFCPFGKKGDRLWVRETYTPDPPQDGTWDFYSYTDGVLYNLEAIPERFRNPANVIYRASWDNPETMLWRPSIFMPRWASRIALEITGIRVERLQQITEESAKAEGCTQDADFSREYPYSYVDQFHRLWNEINGKRADWDSNPWVWVVEFKRCEVPL